MPFEFAAAARAIWASQIVNVGREEEGGEGGGIPDGWMDGWGGKATEVSSMLDSKTLDNRTLVYLNFCSCYNLPPSCCELI